MANRDDVARRAGVSGATVSRVFNHPDRVEPETVRLIRSVAAELGYRPDKNAGALRRRGTGVLVFLEYRGGGTYFWPDVRFFNWLYADVLRGVIQAIGETPFRLEMRTIDALSEIRSIARECDGILAFNTEDPEYAAAVAETGIPYVCAHHTEMLSGFSRCSTDNFAGGRLMGRAFRSAGCQRAVYVSGHLDEVEAHRLRLKGFREGFGREVSLIETSVGIDGGVEAARIIASEIHGGGIDAVCAVNDLTALGILRGLGELHVKVPDDCIVAGYDNLPVDLGLPYKIPSVDLQLGTLYRKAVAGLSAYVYRGTPCNSSLKPQLIPGSLLDPPGFSS
ncbi:LacI family DNA-binding transcriptional regulator [Marispirochaeta sp.]|jgi:LacI family transcriptional regulator|uniref:LacI family DNA-binding transcriptional regulator n=1 Tax=Marispirochaeta sp. TaxID=2038653 RepID=UPI0029C84675|nr:LacI family DNA-binding transcriptional regulator [Marispirochaeta sp.]